jgi:hypothetical protein
MEDDCGIADAIASSFDKNLTTDKPRSNRFEIRSTSVFICGEVFNFGDLGNFGFFQLLDLLSTLYKTPLFAI